MRKEGFSLVELVFATSILVVVSGAIFAFIFNVGNVSEVTQIKANDLDEVQKGMGITIRELRQAVASTIVITTNNKIQYKMPKDLDGNGVAVDVGGSLEISPLRTISRDTTDLNRDGRTTDQLILNEGTKKRVLANHIAADEDLNANNILDTGEDKNGNGQLDHGVWFSRNGNAVVIQLDAYGMSVKKRMYVSSLTETVTPRN